MGIILNGELSAGSGPFNKNLECMSKANKPGFGIPLNSNGINMLTN